MHVLIVNQYALPSGSPGITRHGDLGRELVRRGHDVTVIASRFNYLTRSVPPAGDVQTDSVVFRWLTTKAYSANDRKRVRSMLEFLVRSCVAGVRLQPKPDVVIGSSPQLLAGLSGLLVAWRFRVPFLFEVRDPWPSALVDLGAVKNGGIAHRILETIERLLYRKASRIITVMEHADRRVQEVGEDWRKCVHIPNGASPAAGGGGLPGPLANLIAEEKSASRVLVLYAGAHGQSNGLGDVLDALGHLRRNRSDAYARMGVLFIGDGPEKEYLRQRASREGLTHVHFYQPVPKTAMITAMKHADFVLVHFARADFKRYGMSANKLFDAMSAGRPILLASPLDDTPVDTVRCGIRYEPGSPASLASAFSTALDLPQEERAAMGERGRVEADLKYNVEVTGQQLDTVLRAVAAERRTDR